MSRSSMSRGARLARAPAERTNVQTFPRLFRVNVAVIAPRSGGVLAAMLTASPEPDGSSMASLQRCLSEHWPLKASGVVLIEDALCGVATGPCCLAPQHPFEGDGYDRADDRAEQVDPVMGEISTDQVRSERTRRVHR